MVSFTYTSFAVLAAVSMLQGAQASAVGTAVKGVLGAVGLKVKARGDTSLWERGKSHFEFPTEATLTHTR